MKGCLTILETHRMGDAVLALPFVWGAREAGWAVTAAAPPGTIDVFRLLLAEEQVVELPGRGRTEVLKAARKKWGAGVGICAWADPRAQAVLVCAGYERRIGFPALPVNLFAREAALLPPRDRTVRAMTAALTAVVGPLLTDPVMRKARDQAHAEDWRQLAAVLGVEARLPVSWAGSLEAGGGWLVHPGAGSPWKLWAVERWLQLLDQMEAEGLQPALVEGPGVPHLPWTGRRVPCRTVRDLSDSFRQAAGVVCLDSLAAHLAVSMGKPTVVLFGAMNPCWFAPWGERVRVVNTPAEWPIRRRDLGAWGGTLLHGVKVDEVWAAVRSLVGGG